MTDRTVIFDADKARMLYAFVNTKEPRQQLNGVYIESAPVGGVFLVATDGHRLGVFHDPDGYASEPVIVRLSLAALRMTKSKRSEVAPRRIKVLADGALEFVAYPTVDEYEDVAMFPASDECGPVDRKFPEWRKIWPDDIPTEPATNNYNANYLGTFALEAKGTESAIRVFSFSDNSSAIVLNAKHHDFMGLLMPVRATFATSDSNYPDWFTTQIPTKQVRMRSRNKKEEGMR